MLAWHDLLTALALYLILEGLLPFLNPDSFRRFTHALSELSDSTLRNAGLGSMVVGIVLLYIVR